MFSELPVSKNRFAVFSFGIVCLIPIFSYAQQPTNSANAAADDPRAVARQALKFWSAVDIEGLVKISAKPPRAEEIEKIKANREQFVQRFTSDDNWRWQAVKNWDGKFSDVRSSEKLGFIIGGSAESKPDPTEGSGTKEREFEELEESLICVTLIREDDGWKYDGMFQPRPDWFKKNWQSSDLSPDDNNNGDKKTDDSTDPRAVLDRFVNAVRAGNLENVRALTSKKQLNDTPRRRAPNPDAWDPGDSEIDDQASPENQEPSHAEQLSDLINGQFDHGYDGDLKQWDGRVRQIRSHHEVRVQFGESGREVFVVTLVRMDDSWKFRDIHSPDKQDFQQWGRPMAAN